MSTFGWLGRYEWDAVVIGAGPAGAMSALIAARTGLRVLMLDKAAFPRDKICGCCLNASAIAALDRVGLQGLADQHRAPEITALVLAAGRRRAVLPLHRSRALSRRRLDQALVAAAVQAGAVFMPESLAEVRQADDDQEGKSATVRVRCGGAETVITARAVLACDGLAGRSLASIPALDLHTARSARIGLGLAVDHPADEYPPGVIHMTIGRGGYVGAVRIEDGRLNIAAAVEPALIRAAGGPGAAASGLLAAAGMPPIPALNAAGWRATPALTRRRTVEHGRVLAVGDAAAYVEPFTGEGIGWAMTSGQAAGQLAAEMLTAGWRPGAWTLVQSRLLSRQRRRCASLCWMLRRQPMVEAIVGGLALWATPGRLLAHCFNPTPCPLPRLGEAS